MTMPKRTEKEILEIINTLRDDACIVVYLRSDAKPCLPVERFTPLTDGEWEGIRDEFDRKSPNKWQDDLFYEIVYNNLEDLK